MKCTNCGSTRLKQKTYSTQAYDGIDFYINPMPLKGLRSYVCLDCGHIEFFDDNPES